MRHGVALIALGAVLALCATLPIEFPCLLTTRVAWAVLFTGLLWRRRWTLAALVAATSLAATLYANRQYATLDALRERTTTQFDARVVGAEPRAYGFSHTLRLADGSRAECALDHPLRIGDDVHVRGRLAPYDRPRNPGESDLRILQRSRGLTWHIEECTIVSARSRDDVDAEIVRARMHAWAREKLAMTLGEPDATILAGMLWGERGALPDALREQFQETGTIHVLVTAGLHVGLVAGVVMLLLVRLTLPRPLACTVVALVVLVFAWFSGAHLPALRAASMAIFSLTARAFGRRALSWNTLGAAAIAVLVIDPLQVLDASFWLSFCCVGAIFSLAAPLETLVDPMNAPRAVREAIVLTIATQAGTWPLTAAVFLRFAPYALLANLCIVPMVPLLMLGGAAHLAIAAIVPWASPLSAMPLALLLHGVARVLEVLDGLPWCTIAVAPPPIWAVAAYECALLAFPALLLRNAKSIAAAAIALSAALCLAPPTWPDGKLRVVVLDVGQADSILIITPAHHAMLVDAGGRLERGPTGRNDAQEVGTRIVVPALLHLGVLHLDTCFLTHPHGDHTGGYVPVIEALGCDTFVDSGQRYGGHAFNATLAELRSHNVPIAYPKAGAHWQTDDGVDIRFFGPGAPPIADSPNDVNNNSLIIKFSYGRFCMLLMGDAGIEAEQRVLTQGIPVRCPVLKVGHHGSAYSSSAAFIEAVHPGVAIISDGRHNTFGHPAPQTLQRLQTADAQVLRTDINGAAIVVTDGQRYAVTSMLQTIFKIRSFASP